MHRVFEFHGASDAAFADTWGGARMPSHFRDILASRVSAVCVASCASCALMSLKPWLAIQKVVHETNGPLTSIPAKPDRTPGPESFRPHFACTWLLLHDQDQINDQVSATGGQPTLLSQRCSQGKL